MSSQDQYLVKLPELSTLQIDALGRFLRIPRWAGAFASNELSRVPAQSSFVVNLEDDFRAGSHWCLVVAEPRRAVYVDSFGFPPNSEVTAYLHSTRKDVVWSTLECQALDSTLCGFFALLSLCHLSKAGAGCDVQTVLESLYWPANRWLGCAFNDECIAAWIREVGLDKQLPWRT